MCVAIPGKVLSIEDGKAVVDFSGNQVKAYVGLVNVKVGDYVLVHAGCVIQTMKQQEAEEIVELMNEMESNHDSRGNQQLFKRI
ncbi:MAG: HypC/HybG/HupF family hydrogenase formation chaperone [Roseburia sp.]|nr:HypC/HybG/HupF family hydrogenase formation chaperone [Roseburia sp.]